MYDRQDTAPRTEEFYRIAVEITAGLKHIEAQTSGGEENGSDNDDVLPLLIGSSDNEDEDGTLDFNGARDIGGNQGKKAGTKTKGSKVVNTNIQASKTRGRNATRGKATLLAATLVSSTLRSSIQVEPSMTAPHSSKQCVRQH